ncbi:protein shisa-4-like isoform X2 [Plectropomus leopardus]|uniref:protein shisa-4-like isoform X2 n=1 Tax=Plectropomus leopardus TaxID=160734 RepID=UPI001C4BC514|nr:protein shisa-4-like isoform X2 [Plectropomus leopardus]
MVSRVLSTLVCVLCVILLPAAWADTCSAYMDRDGYKHKNQQCGEYFCCGDCHTRSCCNSIRHRLTQEAQQRCGAGGSSGIAKSKLGTLLGSILGSLFPIIICVGLVICCMAPCCLLYKKCRKGRSRGSQIVTGPTSVISGPQQPFAPSFPSNPGYQPVPGQPGFGGLPNPSAPPPHMGSYGPAPQPGGFGPEVPVVNFIGPSFAQPPTSHEHSPPPYNPAYPSTG